MASWRALTVVAWLLTMLLHVVIVFRSLAIALSGPLLALVVSVSAVSGPLWPRSRCCCWCGCGWRSCWGSEATTTDSTGLKIRYYPMYICRYHKPHLLTVNAHVFSVCPALSLPRPTFTVLVEVLAKVAEVASDRTIWQHPGWVAAALRQAGPCRTISRDGGGILSLVTEKLNLLILVVARLGVF